MLYRSYQFGGTRLPSWCPWHLRNIAERTGPITLGRQLRHRQIKPYCRPSREEDIPGYKVSLADKESKPSGADKKEMKRLDEWFLHGGERYPGWQKHREFGFTDLHVMLLRNWIELDAVFLEARRNTKGDIIEPVPVDPATMRRVSEGGWANQVEDFRPDLLIYPNQRYSEWVAKERNKLLRGIDPAEIKYVQVHHNLTPNMAYTSDDLLWMHLNPRTDPRWFGLGQSPIEMMIQIISGWLNAFTFHVENTSTASVPAIAITTDAHMGRQQIAKFSESVTARFQGPKGQQKIPVLSDADWKVLQLRGGGPRDREYQWFLQFLMQLIGGIYGVDFAEAGFKMGQQSTLAQHGMKDQQKTSKSIGLQDLLHSFERLWTCWLVKMGREEFVFCYTGDQMEDKKLISDLRTASVKSYKTINELRAEEDLKPIEGGDIILDPQFMQGKQMDQQAGMMGDMGGGGADDDIDGMVDEAFAEAA